MYHTIVLRRLTNSTVLIVNAGELSEASVKVAVEVFKQMLPAGSAIMIDPRLHMVEAVTSLQPDAYFRALEEKRNVNEILGEAARAAVASKFPVNTGFEVRWERKDPIA